MTLVSVAALGRGGFVLADTDQVLLLMAGR